jgi:hypothetical protein
MKRIPYILTMLALILGLNASVFAQNEGQGGILEDVIHLKNGSVIRGEIIEREIGKHIKVQIMGGTVMVFPEDEIKVILREPKAASQVVYPNQPQDVVEKKEISAREKGFYQMISLGIQTISEDFLLIPFPSSYHYRTGYSFNQHLNLGIGFGVEAFENYGTLPVYIDYHGELGRVKKTMPHYFVNAGYAFGAWGVNGWTNGNLISQDFPGGPMLHTGFGFKLNFRSKSEMLFTLGYKVMSLHSDFVAEQFEFDGSGNPTVTRVEGSFDTSYNSVVLQASFGF